MTFTSNKFDFIRFTLMTHCKKKNELTHVAISHLNGIYIVMLHLFYMFIKEGRTT